MLTSDSLMMLLIQSDMFKALWFMLYPVVNLSAGPILRGSRFCQVNGFFLSLGIEASGTNVWHFQVGISLTYYRFCCSDDCHPYCFIHLQAEAF